MRWTLRCAALGGLFLALQVPAGALAAGADGTTVPGAGIYIFDAAYGAVVPCVMLLDDAEVPNAPGFHPAWLSGGCESTFYFLTVLSGWEEMEGGGVRLIGAEGSVMGEFEPNEDGHLEAVVQNDGRRYTLRPTETIP